jgi:hypothetical protein
MLDRDFISPDGALRFVVRSADGDITMGFDGYTWHTHADVLAASSAGTTVAAFWSSRSPEGAVRIVAEHAEKFIAALLADKPIIATLKESGIIRDIWITDDPVAKRRYCLPNETIDFRLWDGTKVPADDPA